MRWPIFQIHWWPSLDVRGFAIYPNIGARAVFGIGRSDGKWTIAIGQRRWKL